MVGGVPLVSVEVFGLFSLGFIPGGLQNIRRDFFFLSRVLSFPFYFFYFCFVYLKLTPYSTPYLFYMLVEWQEVTKRFRSVRLGVGEVLLGKHLLQAV